VRAAASRRGRPRGPADRAHRLRIAAVVVGLATLAGVVATLLFPLPRGASSGTTGGYSAPTFVRELDPAGPGALREPLGLVVDGGRVYVADASRGEIVVLSTSGTYRRAFGGGSLVVPLYLARNPLDGRLYVTDRGLRSIAVFSADGSRTGTFAPVAADEAAVSAVSAWQPLAIGFAEDGTMYVSDADQPSRVLAFDRAGRLAAVSLVDTSGVLGAAGLSYVNGIAVVGDRVVVTDSNNSRLVLFDRALRPVAVAACPGLPRGVVALPDGWAPGAVVADTSGGQVAVIDETGASRVRAGGDGSSAGMLRQPTGVAMDVTGLAYVADTGNRRISVWRVSAPRRVDLLSLVMSDPRTWAATLLLGVGAGLSILLFLASRNSRAAV
jgi:DNA-binding beta-propeller fold protein YncE